jgi:hypothetical protein
VSQQQVAAGSASHSLPPLGSPQWGHGLAVFSAALDGAGYDQFAHGKSPGTPRLIPSFDDLVDDLALFAMQLRTHYTVQQKVCASLNPWWLCVLVVCMALPSLA